MKILITGGCGAIGSIVLEYFLKSYSNENDLIINLDAQTYCANNYHTRFLKLPNYKFIKGNICDEDLISYILDIYKPDIVLHLAAETDVDNSFLNSTKFTETNVIGTHTLLECAKKHSDILFIHMSTDEVYGEVNNNEICHENSMYSPSNPYSATKASAEMLCHAYSKSFNLPIIILRCNNVISGYQHHEKLIPHCVNQLLNNKKIKIHGKGTAKRTFIDAYDIAKAIDIIIKNGKINEIYNIGTNMEYTVMQVVEKIVNIMKPNANIDELIEYVPDRLYQDYRYSIDSSKLIKLGWNAEISFDESINNLIEIKEGIILDDGC
jgi:UDP-glucose 4,6-dehydratase